MFARVPREGVSNESGLSTMAIFSAFTGYILGTFRDKPKLLYCGMESLLGFPLTSKYVTLSDLNGFFTLNSV